MYKNQFIKKIEDIKMLKELYAIFDSNFIMVFSLHAMMKKIEKNQGLNKIKKENIENNEIKDVTNLLAL